MPSRLLHHERFSRNVEAELVALVRVVRAYRDQDSDCISYVVDDGDRRLFVKRSLAPRGAESLARAATVHGTVLHPALPALLRVIPGPEGPVHVYTWVPGEVLYDYVTMDGAAGRRDPTSAHARFRALPVDRIVDALDVVFDLHVVLADAGFVAVDFYDGCILYDFAGHQLWVCDIDEYHVCPFMLASDRLPGSRRFMAPEEFVRGSTIDQRTNVFTLGCTATVLLSDGRLDAPAWRGTEPMRTVLRRATQPDPAERFPTVAAFVHAWREASAAA